MTTATKNLRTCPKGHQYYKTSDCPTCPVCEQEKKPADGFLSRLANPARNALLHVGIDSLEKLAAHTEKEILKLHGMGPKSIPVLKEALADKGLRFKQ